MDLLRRRRGRLHRVARRDLRQAGIRMIRLHVPGYESLPDYSKTTAGKCCNVGMEILSCTPEELAEAMAHITRR